MIPAMHFGLLFYQVHQRTTLGETSSSSLMQKACHWGMPSSQRAVWEEEESLILHKVWGSETLRVLLFFYLFQDFPEVIVSLRIPIRWVTLSKYLLQSFNCYSHLWEELKCKWQMDDGCRKGWEGKLWVDPITSKGSATLPRKCVRSWDIAIVGIKLPALFNTKYLAASPLIRNSEEK